MRSSGDHVINPNGKSSTIVHTIHSQLFFSGLVWELIGALGAPAQSSCEIITSFKLTGSCSIHPSSRIILWTTIDWGFCYSSLADKTIRNGIKNVYLQNRTWFRRICDWSWTMPDRILCFLHMLRSHVRLSVRTCVIVVGLLVNYQSAMYALNI